MVTFITCKININNMTETKSRISFFPKHTLGKLSVELLVLSIIFFGVLMALIFSGQKGGDTFFSNLLLAIPGLLVAICGVAAFFTGIISIVKEKECSILVYLSTGIGFFILLFVASEILFPH